MTKTPPDKETEKESDETYYFGGLKVKTIKIEEAVYAVAQSPMSSGSCSGPFGPLGPFGCGGPFVGPFGPFGPFAP